MKQKRSWLAISVYTVLVCVISVILTLVIKSSIDSAAKENGADNDRTDGFEAQTVNYEKKEAIAKEFDRFFAFSSPIGMHVISEFDLLCQEDIETLKKNRPAGNGAFYVYLGVADGVDRVIMIDDTDPDNFFVFESALSYSFEDIISEFENLSGRTLDDDFLTASDYDELRRSENGGIKINYRIYMDLENGYRTRHLYYKAIIDGKVYVIDK